MKDTSLPYIALTMGRRGLHNLPDWPCPHGYSLRLYRPGDAAHWARIETGAGEFSEEAKALGYFTEHFLPCEERLRAGCFFAVEDATGLPVGTAMAWQDERWGAVQHRVHWVGVHPDHQRRGLCKAMLARVLACMAQFGPDADAFLTTQTHSWVAIGVYLKAGFSPRLETPDCPAGWRMVTDKLGLPPML